MTMQTKRLLFLLLILAPLFLLGQSVQIDVLAPLPDQARDDAVGFTVDGTGYILGGRRDDFGLSPQVWAYHPESDHWEAKADFPGAARQYVSAVTLQGQAHILGGLGDPSLYLNDHWVYDHEADTWTQLADLPGAGRFAACAFVLNDILYYGLGRGESSTYADLWRYEPDQDTWSHLLDFPDSFYGAHSCAIDDVVVISGGIREDDSIADEVWSFNGTELQERRPLDVPQANADILYASEKVYMVGGRTPTVDSSDELQEYEQFLLGCGISYQWNQRSEKLPFGRRNGASFSIGEIGYYFGGKDSTGTKTNELLGFRWVKNSDSALILYPNPTQDVFSIHADAQFQRIDIYDSAGNQVWSKMLRPASNYVKASIRDYAPGLYFVKLDDREVVRLVVR